MSIGPMGEFVMLIYSTLESQVYSCGLQNNRKETQIVMHGIGLNLIVSTFCL